MRQTTVSAQYGAGAEENFISGLPCAIDAVIPKVQRERTVARLGFGHAIVTNGPDGIGKVGKNCSVRSRNFAAGRVYRPTPPNSRLIR